MLPINISSDRVHNFNRVTLAIDRQLAAEFEVDLLIMPEELRRNSVVAFSWHTAGDHRVCPLCSSLEGNVYPVESPEYGRIAPPIHLNCFLSSRTPIYTLDGWKKIGDIAVGDQVLTHRGRFRRVSRLFRSRSYRGKVVTVTMNGSYKKFVVTPEHPFLTENGWKEASKLSRKDKILILATRCRRCGKPAPYYRTYCSHRCLSKDITNRQWSDPEHRKLMSSKASVQLEREYRLGIRDPQSITEAAHKRVKELFNSKDPWGWQIPKKLAKALGAIDLEARNKESSRRMKRNNPVYLPGARERQSKFMKQLFREHPEKHPNFIVAQRGHQTKIEKRIGDLLGELGYQTVFNHRVDGYFIDWAIPNLKIGIECDGAYWHQDKEKDFARDKRIESFGWTLLHLKESEIKNNIESCRQKIVRLANNHLGKYEFVPLKIKNVRSRLLGRGRMLYNFAVEEDESYIAKGLVSHNCRCVLSYITARERGVEERIKKYEPIDPKLLEKWSSKVYTDAEIREMVKHEKEFIPEEEI